MSNDDVKGQGDGSGDGDDAPEREWTPEAKKDVLRKYAKGLEEIWKRLVDQGPPTGNPIELFQPAMELTEKTLEKILE